MTRRRAWLRAYHGFLATMPDVSSMDPFDAWMAFAGAHDGRCAICFHQTDLVEDHDHCTGLVRGLLCRSCNSHARSGVAHRPVREDRFAPFTIYCQYPPTAAANYRAMYLDADEPAPQLHRAIWLAGPGGLERPGSDIQDNAAAKVGL